MIKTLARSIREYKKPAMLTPLLVVVEVVLECIIPFIIAKLVNEMQAGCGMDVIVKYGVQLVIMAMLVAWSSASRQATPVPQRPQAFAQKLAQGHVLPHSGLFL